MSNPEEMSISGRNRMHEMLAELGALVTTTPGSDATAPAFELDRAFRDRIAARGAADGHRRL